MRFAKIEIKNLLLTAVLCSLAGCGSSSRQNVAGNSVPLATNVVQKREPTATAIPTIPTTPQPTEKQIAALERVQKLAANWADSKIAALPRNNNWGIFICEPGTSNGADVANFGAGIARWLQFHVGGQGELGKTPTWREVELTRRALKKTNLQFSTVDAAQLPNLLGITHTVTGRIDRTANAYVLALQLWKFEKHTKNWETLPVGNLVELRGSRDDIARQLPRAARHLSQRLNISSPKIPRRIELNSAELQWLGSLSWVGKAQNVSTQKSALWTKLLQKSALASMMKASSGDSKAFNQLIQLAPGNALAWNLRLRSADANFQQLRSRFRRNYAISESPDAVQNAPQNPHAWLQMKAPKREALFSALQATRLAPRLASAWREVSRRARILNEDRVAELALWKALRLDGTDVETWQWGAQLLGKNGLRDAEQFAQLRAFAKREKVSDARLVSAFVANQPAKKIAEIPQRSTPVSPLISTDATPELPQVSSATTNADIAREEARLAQNEHDGATRARLAKLYEQSGDVEKARGALQGWISVQPRSVTPLLEMAQFELRQNNRGAAQKVLLRAQRLEPQNSTVRQLMQQALGKQTF